MADAKITDLTALASGESLEIDMVNENMYGLSTVTTSIRILRRGDEYGNLPNF